MKKKTTNQKFTDEEKNQIYCDLIQYLALLHSENIAHCDIKPNNIFYIESENKYVLADFGIAVQFTTDQLEKMYDGSRSFRMKLNLIKGVTEKNCSPELKKILINNKNKNNVSEECFDLFLNDIYSLGLVFLRVSSINSEDSMKIKMEDANKFQEINILPLMLDQIPEKRFNIFELMILIEGGKRYIFPKNPKFQEEAIIGGVSDTFNSIFIGTSQKFGDIIVIPYLFIEKQMTISYKETKKKITQSKNLIETSIFIKDESFDQDTGLFQINKIGKTEFEIKFPKT